MDQIIRLFNQRNFSECLAECKKKIEIEENSAALFNIAGAAANAVGQNNEAKHFLLRASELDPGSSDIFNNLGTVLKSLGDLDGANIAFKKSIKNNPSSHITFNNYGNLLQEQKKFRAAVECYTKAIQINPKFSNAFHNMGNALNAMGESNSAITAYQKAISLNPRLFNSYNNLGNTLEKINMPLKAIEAYDKCIMINPNFADAHYNMANSLTVVGKFHDAIRSYRKAIELNPDFSIAFYRLGNALKEIREFPSAIQSYRKALDIQPNLSIAQALLFYRCRQICDFNCEKEIQEKSWELINSEYSIPPFVVLSFTDDPKYQLEMSKKWSKANHTSKESNVTSLSSLPKTVNVGIFGADFYDHATMQLLFGVLREMNSKFKIVIFDYGRNKADWMTNKIKTTVYKYLNLSNTADDEIIKIALMENLHIAIDLKGYTTHSKTGIFQNRLAPVQINYLGYPGTLGTDFFDYLIADKTVVPAEYRKYYTENLIYLPNSYQPNDNMREISEIKLTRADLDLPKNGFIFACFNNSYKISSVEFTIWMRLLSKVNNSVLWLLKSNEYVEQNLKTCAERFGVNQERIIFAPSVPHSMHLARQKFADLFLDTFNVNAHTTASDALWGGLPVVTLMGRQFSARVAASLLYGLGLDELVTDNVCQYEKVALQLAENPEALTAMKARLNRNRYTHPLFDTTTYTRNLEYAFIEALKVNINCKQPRDIFVGPTNESGH